MLELPPPRESKEAAPALKATPSSLVFEAKKWQDRNRLGVEPFERVLCKLPQDMNPGPAGPQSGPMGSASEPVWFEMNKRLQAILKRQGRRAERRRKRRLRSKLLTGRTKGTSKKSDGQDLREYFDRAALERAQGQADVPGEAAGEFLGKVHEQYLQRRERLQLKKFQVRGTVRDVVIGEDPPKRMGKIVRPFYCPPPGVHTEQIW